MQKLSSQKAKPEQKETQQISAQDSQQHYIGDYEKAPKFTKDNPHITFGYRINFNNPKRILKSLFMVHNESVNIWSHCLPAIVIIIFLLSFLFMIDGESMKKSINQCQEQIQKGIHHYTQALNNISLITEYDTFSQKTKDEMEEWKHSILNSYQQFITKFQQSSNHFQSLVESEVEGFKSNFKGTLKQNLHLFERAKLQFQRKIAPMLIQQFNTKINSSWINQLKMSVENMKNLVDSDNFQYIQLHQHRPNPQQISRWPIFVFLTTAAICLLSSALFHLFYPMSAKTYTITNRFDYAGINLLISGSAFPPFYYGMYCQIQVAILYLTCTILVAVFCFVVCLFQWIHKAGNQKYKAFLFGGFGLSLSIPLSHMIINEVVYDNYGDSFEFLGSVPYYVLLGASYLGGLYIYTVRCPERNNPGKYNLCGHSHQIWHGMVVLGILFTFLGALENFEMRKVSQCPA